MREGFFTGTLGPVGRWFSGCRGKQPHSPKDVWFPFQKFLYDCHSHILVILISSHIMFYIMIITHIMFYIMIIRIIVLFILCFILCYIKNPWGSYSVHVILYMVIPQQHGHVGHSVCHLPAVPARVGSPIALLQVTEVYDILWLMFFYTKPLPILPYGK